MTERKVSNERVGGERLRDLKERAGLKYMPTQMTYEARKAANSLPCEINEHFFARNWEDKPHRVVFDLCEEIERLSELLALRSSVKTVGVKALEWVALEAARSAEDPRTEETGDYEAVTPFGIYQIEMGFGSDEYVWSLSFNDVLVESVRGGNDPEKLMAAAQADYERRILSAIEAPAAEGEVTEEQLQRALKAWFENPFRKTSEAMHAALTAALAVKGGQ